MLEAPKTIVYEQATAQGVLATRLVVDAIDRLDNDLGKRNKELQQVIELHTLQGTQAMAVPLTALTVVPATLKAAADLPALFKTDVDTRSIGYGEGERSLFATQLGSRCPDKVGGVGMGYLGELAEKQYDGLLAKLRDLATQRGEFANRIAIVQRLADAAKNDKNRPCGGGGKCLRAAEDDRWVRRLAEGGRSWRQVPVV